MQYLHLCRKVTVVVKTNNGNYVNKKAIYADNTEFLDILHNINRTIPCEKMVVTNKILGPLDKNAHIATTAEIQEYIADFVKKVKKLEEKREVTL